MRSHSHQKGTQASVAPQYRVQPRSFPSQPDAASPESDLHDLQTQLETAQRFGHSFSKIYKQRAAAESSSNLESKAAIADSITPIAHQAKPAQSIQRAVDPDLKPDTQVEIFHDKQWQLATILKAELKKGITTYSVRRVGGKKTRTYKHTSDEIRPIASSSSSKKVEYTPPSSRRQSIDETDAVFGVGGFSSQESFVPPLREKSSQFEKSRFQEQPPPLRTPPGSLRGIPTFNKSQLDQEQPPPLRTPPGSLRGIPPFSRGMTDFEEDFEQGGNSNTLTRTPPRSRLETPSFNRGIDDFNPKTLTRTPPRSRLAPPSFRKGIDDFNSEGNFIPEDDFNPHGNFIPEIDFNSKLLPQFNFWNPQIPQSTQLPVSSPLKHDFAWQPPKTDEEYIDQVAAGFYPDTGVVFKKLWETAPKLEKSQIKHLFSPDPRLKNLVDLEYILEALDPKHRVDQKFVLETPARQWAKDSTKAYFFDWVSTQQNHASNLNLDVLQVDYFDDQRRQDYLLELGSTVTWAQSRQAPKGDTIYVMSQADEFYASIPTSTAKGTVHHSSFMSGQAVKCAGHMLFEPAGKISEINLSSGHYRPKAKQMLNALEVLNNNNVNLKEVKADVKFGEEPVNADQLLQKGFV